MADSLSLRKRILIFAPYILLGLAGFVGLIMVDKQLSPLQFINLILVIYALLKTVEVISVAREEKHRAKILKDSSSKVIGKKGVVLEDCSPEGTVKIGQEIWKALTARGLTLKKGDEIIIRQRQGLIVTVEPSGKVEKE
jgi:membrane protein implicated in regulation of membrane protease activity